MGDIVKVKSKKKGNTLIIFLVLCAIIILINTLGIYTIFMQINAVVYNIKSDIYLLGRSAVLNMNKREGAAGEYSVNIDELKTNIKELIIKNYNLETNMTNENSLIKKVEVLDCTYNMVGIKDNFTQNITEKPQIHIIVKVYIKPIMFENILKGRFIFKVHNDIKLDFLEV